MTDTNELRAAAERFRKCESGERGKVVYDFEDEEMDDFNYRMLENSMTSDLRFLARAYLAEHPADDGEPVTYKRLRNIGFTRGMQVASTSVLTLWSGKKYVSVNIKKDGFVGVAIGDSDVADYLPAGFSMQTMGDVRRLCRALGIELKEGGK